MQTSILFSTFQFYKCFISTRCSHKGLIRGPTWWQVIANYTSCPLISAHVAGVYPAPTHSCEWLYTQQINVKKRANENKRADMLSEDLKNDWIQEEIWIRNCLWSADERKKYEKFRTSVSMVEWSCCMQSADLTDWPEPKGSTDWSCLVMHNHVSKKMFLGLA